MSEFKTFRIGDLAKVQGGYAFKSSDFKDVGVPVLKITNVQDRKIELNSLSHVDPSLIAGLERFFVKSGDVLISMTGNGPHTNTALVGRTARFSGPDNTYLLNQRVGRFVVNEEVLRKRFLYYFISRPEINRELALRSTGSANQANINATTIESFEISLPDIQTQDKILAVLGGIDDKIELNNQINETLESMAKTIFKEWFIDFGPVKAKSEDKEPSCMSDETSAIFPNSFEESELGPIPKGWQNTPLYDLADWQNGMAFKSIHFSETGLPVVKIAELKSGINSSTKKSDQIHEDKFKINDGDILFSWSGSPDTSIDTFLWDKGEAWLNQHIFKVTSKNVTKEFIYFLLKYMKPIFIEIARNKQTTGLGHVTVSDLKRLQITLPNPDVINKFQKFAEPIMNKYFSNLKENQNLHKSRDLLLPKLISGETHLVEVAID